MQGFNRVPAFHEIEDPVRREEVVEWLADRWDLNILQPSIFEPDANGATLGQMGGAQLRPTLEAICQPLYVGVYETGIEPLGSRSYQDWQAAFYEMVERGEKDINPRVPDSFKR